MGEQISGTNDKFLRKEFYLPKVFEIMNPDLAFIDSTKPGMLPTVPADGRAVNYKKETTSASSDTKKKTPRIRTESAEWTYVNITQMETASAILKSNGFAISIDRDAIRFTQGIDEIKRAFERVGFWLAEGINTDMVTAITGGATTPTWTPTAVWSAANATPVDDMIKLEAQMEREGYPYSMTDIYVHKDNWFELKGYLTSVDVELAKQRAVYGMPQIDKNTINIPVVQSDIHKCASGLSEGYALALDRNNPCGTVFYNNDPAFAPATIPYKTVVAGKEVTKQVKNFGINTHKYVEDDTHNTIIQLWYDMITVIKEPYAALYDSGI